MTHKDTATTAREECDTRNLQWFTHWLSRAEAWMAQSERAVALSIECQELGLMTCAALAARDAVLTQREYQRCLVNADSWL